MGWVNFHGNGDKTKKGGRYGENGKYKVPMRNYTLIPNNQSLITAFMGMVMLFLAINLFAQGPDTLWMRTYGGTGQDYGFSVQQTADGGYIVAGFTKSFGTGGEDVYLIKTDANGDTTWTKTYGGIWDDEGISVQQTFDGGYIIIGGTYSFVRSGWDVYLIKTDGTGNILWTRIYAGKRWDYGYSVQQTSDSGYIITGRTYPLLSSLSYDVYFIKTDASGNALWTRTYGGDSHDIGYSVQETSDGGYIIAGYTASFGAGSYDVYLIKTGTKGNTLWTKTYGGGKFDVGYSVQETSDGGYIIAGGTTSFGVGASDVYLIKTDVNGDILWTRTYGRRGEDMGYSAQQTSDGGYIVTGVTSSFGAGDHDVYLIKTDADGDTLWTKTYGGIDDDYGYSVQETSDGGYIIAGYTGSFGAGRGDVYLIKTRPLLKLTSPNGGEVLVGNTIRHITWIPEGTYFGSYRLLYSLNGGESYPYIIADRISPNSGLYSWKIPEIDCNTCRVKVQIRDMKGYVIEEDESDSDFTIVSTGIEEEESLPKAFFISCCKPNPFSQKTTIKYTIPDAGYTPQDFSLTIYDISGRVVRDLTDNLVSCIRNHVSTVTWDGRNNSGERVSSGVYFLRFEAGGYNATRKLLIMR